MTDYSTRKPFVPVVGTIYENKGGSVYYCLDYDKDIKTARFINVKSAWTLTAVGVGIYDDGKIDWDRSFCGTFNEDILRLIRQRKLVFG